MPTDQKTEHSALLNTQLNAEESPTKQKSSELVEREQIVDTPFWIIGNKETGYFLTMGKYRLTEPMKTKTAVRTYLRANTWNVTLQMCLLVYNDVSSKIPSL